MSYFKDFDYIQYDYTIKSDPEPIIEAIVDLTERVQLKLSDETLDSLCNKIVVPEGYTPEKLAYELYNDPYLHWTILYVNNITGIHGEWPLSDIALRAYVTKTYGEGKEEDIHHYEKMPERAVIDFQFCIDTYQEEPLLITNFEHEYTKNELKRYIRVVKPEYIAGFVESFRKAMVKTA